MSRPALVPELAESAVAVLVLAERHARVQRLHGYDAQAQATNRAVLRFRWALRRLVPHLGEIEAAELMAGGRGGA